MRRIVAGLAGIAATAFAFSSAGAQQTIKIGLILPYSGQFADPGAQADNGIKLYMQQHGGTVAGIACLIELEFLGGRKMLDGYDLFSLVRYA